MIRYIIVSVVSGTFVLLAEYNLKKGQLSAWVISIGLGFILGTIFLLLHKSLPGKSNLIKGVSFAFIVWFFEIFMGITMHINPYVVFQGLFYPLMFGLIYGLILKPFSIREKGF